MWDIRHRINGKRDASPMVDLASGRRPWQSAFPSQILLETVVLHLSPDLGLGARLPLSWVLSSDDPVEALSQSNHSVLPNETFEKFEASSPRSSKARPMGTWSEFWPSRSGNGIAGEILLAAPPTSRGPPPQCWPLLKRAGVVLRSPMRKRSSLELGRLPHLFD
jgi:hypothetical protein